MTDTLLPPNGVTPPIPPQQMTPLRAIDRVRTAFYASRERMEIPEWPDADGHPLEIFFTAVTPADVEAINARSPKTNAESNAFLLIAKAHDDAGKALFSYGDLHALLTESAYNIMLRIVTAMNNEDAGVYENYIAGLRRIHRLCGTVSATREPSRALRRLRTRKTQARLTPGDRTG